MAAISALDVARTLIALVSVAIFALVGRAVGRRKVSPDASLAKGMFQFWWYGIAGLTLITPLLPILKLLHLDTFDVYVPLIAALLLLVFAAIAGLVYYLAYLYTGKKWLLGPILVFYAALDVWFQAIMVEWHPYDYGIPTQACPGASPDQAALLDQAKHAICGNATFSLVFGLLLSVPVVLAAAAYFLLYFRSEDRTARYRIAMVSGALLVWFGTSVAGTLTGMGQNTTWALVSQGVSLVAALAVLAAYKPPSWIRKRYGIEAVPEG